MNNLVISFFRWLLLPGQLVVVLLCGAVMASAIGIAYSSYLVRQSYAELQRLGKHQDDLEDEYEALLLERSAWADYTRLHRLADRELAMVAPRPDEMVVVK